MTTAISVSLLERLRLQPDPASWRRLVDLYTPLLRHWLRRYLLQPPDAETLVQEILTLLIRELTQSGDDLRPGSFRRWLRTTMVSHMRRFFNDRRAGPPPTGSHFDKVLDQLATSDSVLSRLWDEEHDRHVV